MIFPFCLTEHRYWETNVAHNSPNEFIDPFESLWNQAKAGPLMLPRLGRRGGLFLDWASTAFEDGERRGSGELSEDNSSSVGRSMSSSTMTSLPLSGQDGGSGRGGPPDFSAWLASNLVHWRSISSRNRFACSLNSAISLAYSSCLASISWHQRRNWSLRGWFYGLLDMTVSFDGMVGCSRIAKASKIERSPGSGCTQALAYRL